MNTSTVLLASGSNARGQLANGSLDDSHTFAPCNFLGCSPGKLPLNARRVLHVASGSNHTLVLLERQNEAGDKQTELWGCGDGAKGQLGPAYIRTVEENLHAPETSRSILRPLDLPLHDNELSGYTCRLIASAWETSYVVCSCAGKGDVVISMGANDFGDLGIGESRKGKEAARSLNIVKFDHINIHRKNLNIDGLAIESLTAGSHHTIVHASCPLVSMDTPSTEHFIVGWGASRHGQLGPIPKTARPPSISATPRIIPMAVTPSHDRIVFSSLGNQHSVFLHASGRLSCLGSDKKGQLRDLTTLKNVQQVDCTWNGTYVIAQSHDNGDNCIFSTGSHSRGQLGRVVLSTESESTTTILAPVQFPIASMPHRLMRIACGSEHVLTILRKTSKDEVSHSENTATWETEVWGWGWNEHGNLGIGTTEDIVLPSKIWPSAPVGDLETFRRAVGIWAGCGTSWIALEQCE